MLTPHMQRALSVLESTGDRALVRLWSQWWCAESERKRSASVGTFFRLPNGQVSGPLNTFAPTLTDNQWPVILISTSTVNALVKRGHLKRKGRERAELK